MYLPWEYHKLFRASSEVTTREHERRLRARRQGAAAQDPAQVLVAEGDLPTQRQQQPSPAVVNHLVHTGPTFISDTHGGLRYLWHSSTWFFSRQVLHLAFSSAKDLTVLEAFEVTD
jgi:hypothetical protein